MAATRPSSATGTGSSPSDPWWEAKDFAQIHSDAARYWASGDFAGFEATCQKGLQIARQSNNRTAEIAYLNAVGNVRLSQFHYASALEVYLEASRLAEAAHDLLDIGAISENLANVYQQVGDRDSAVTAVERGLDAVKDMHPPPFYKAHLLMLLGRLQVSLGDGAPTALFREAIETGLQQAKLSPSPHDWDVIPEAWDLLGADQLTRGNLPEAGKALEEALHVRTLHKPGNLPLSYWHLGELRLAQSANANGPARLALLAEALQFTDRAISGARTGSGPAMYALLHQRGLIQEASGQTAKALADFGAAIDAAAHWRLAVPRAASLLTAANVELDGQVFESFVNAAACESLRTGSRYWAAQAFLALELNRATSLRETQTVNELWRQRLPGKFWETLGKLRATEARGAGTSQADGLRLELTEMEAQAGVGISKTIPENFRGQSSLSHFQSGLGESELLLSLHVGEHESFLWAVTRTSLHLYRLPGKSRIREQVSQFRDAVVERRSGARDWGERLYDVLFSQLGREEAGKKSWLLSLDGPLFELPFAALVVRQIDNKAVYLVEQHSIQIVPGALFSAQDQSPGGGYLAVGDPIYNSADPRRLGTHTAPKPSDLGHMNRLVGSHQEVQESAQAWRRGSAAGQDVEILEGADAHRDTFLEALGRNPSVIHIATHVLMPEARRDQAFLAFSLDSDGRPELLAASDIEMLHLPGALVVMTGCATATGDERAGTGLLGLTRAWPMAGAKAVVATGWAVPDSAGEVLPAFYRHLGRGSAAEALRQSQIEMIHSGTWQSEPAYWASFEITGGSR